MWIAHFNGIRDRPNRAQKWALCLEYDSEIRRRALVSSIDPSIFHTDVWDDLEPTHIAKRAMVLLRTENKKDGRFGRANGDLERDQSSSTGRFQPYKGAKQSSRDAGDSFRPKRKFRCFVCASDEDFHKSRNCTADRLVNGKPSILSGKTRRDRAGNAYCFSFNGYSGCPGGSDCEKGHHWCSICGDKSARHCAQDCSTI